MSIKIVYIFIYHQAKFSSNASARSSFSEIALALTMHPSFVSNPITKLIKVLYVPKYFPAKFKAILEFFVYSFETQVIPYFLINY